MLAPRPAKSRRLRVPKAAVLAIGSPYAAAIKLGRFDNPEHVIVAIVGAIVAHGVLALGAGLTHAVHEHEEPRRKVEITAALEKPPPPPPKPVEPPKAKEPPPEPKEKLARPSEPPPAPAQAAKVIAAAPTADGPVDMSGFDLVVGEAKTYSGGYSSSKGTSTVAVAEPAKVGGIPNVPRKDFSRSAAPARDDWTCPWPEEEQTTDIREAKVAIRVRVDRDGDPKSVEIVNAPPGGFGAAAQQCAGNEKYLPALDMNGDRIGAVTPPFVVHFYR
jgi:protein TonB